MGTGELAAGMQYSIQGLNCEDAERKDLLMDIGTEELSHLEVVGTSPTPPCSHEIRSGSGRGRSPHRIRERRRRQSFQFAGKSLDGRLFKNH
jgi:hypothetical protein